MTHPSSNRLAVCRLRVFGTMAGSLLAEHSEESSRVATFFGMNGMRGPRPDLR